MQRWLFLFLRSQALSLLLGPSDSELSDHILTSCFVLQVYVCGCFQWSVCGRGVTVTVYKPVEINIVFLQLGRLKGSEPGAVTWSESQLWGRETWPQRVKMHFPFLTELFALPLASCLRRSCHLCRLCASRPPPRPLLWRSLCWSSWRRSSCCSRTPPSLTSASRASAGLLWWGLGLKPFKAGWMCT